MAGSSHTCRATTLWTRVWGTQTRVPGYALQRRGGVTALTGGGQKLELRTETVSA